MTDIPVLLFVVSCSANLLICEDEPAASAAFADMPACLAARREALAVPGARPGRVRLAKCRYDPAVARGGRARAVTAPAVN